MAHKTSMSRYRILAHSICLIFCLVGFVFAVHVAAIGISQGFRTNDKGLEVGMVAALSSESSDTNPIVERANESNEGKVVGIVTTIDANLLTLTNAEAKVHVTTSGEAPAYVSDVNGTLKKGDFVAVSPLTGIGMKADDTDNYVVGVALEDFKTADAKPKQVTTIQGSQRTALINKLKMSIEPSSRGQNNQKSKPFLILFGQSVTGKSVSQTQVVTALIIFFLLLVVEGSILYGAVYSTIISIGRNPLARAALFRQLLQVSGVAMLILLFGLGAIYAILWI